MARLEMGGGANFASLSFPPFGRLTVSIVELCAKSKDAIGNLKFIFANAGDL